MAIQFAVWEGSGACIGASVDSISTPIGSLISQNSRNCICTLLSLLLASVISCKRTQWLVWTGTASQWDCGIIDYGEHITQLRRPLAFAAFSVNAINRGFLVTSQCVFWAVHPTANWMRAAIFSTWVNNDSELFESHFISHLTIDWYVKCGHEAIEKKEVARKCGACSSSFSFNLMCSA